MSLKVKDPNTGEWVNAAGGGGSVTVDDSLSPTSTNPVQNKVITNEINGKQIQMQFDVMPDAGDYNGVVIIYTGNDTPDYVKGNSYISDGTSWASTSSSDAQPLTEAQLNALLNILD